MSKPRTDILMLCLTARIYSPPNKLLNDSLRNLYASFVYLHYSSVDTMTSHENTSSLVTNADFETEFELETTSGSTLKIRHEGESK
jgi:flagellar motor switch protein FliM